MRPDQEIIRKIAALRRCAPREFDEVIDALRQYSDETSRLCVQSPPEQLSRLQGKAQQCAEFAALFADACKTADRIDRKPIRRDFSAAV